MRARVCVHVHGSMLEIAIHHTQHEHSLLRMYFPPAGDHETRNTRALNKCSDPVACCVLCHCLRKLWTAGSLQPEGADRVPDTQK